MGRLGHELRNQVHVAISHSKRCRGAPSALEGVPVGCWPAASWGMRDLIDSALAEVRLEAGIHRRDPVSLRGFVGEIALTAQMHADSRSIELVVDAVDPELVISVDPQLLASA